MALDEFDLLVKKVEDYAANADDASRKMQINRLRTLAMNLETPLESVQRIMYTVIIAWIRMACMSDVLKEL